MNAADLAAAACDTHGWQKVYDAYWAVAEYGEWPDNAELLAGLKGVDALGLWDDFGQELNTLQPVEQKTSAQDHTNNVQARIASEEAAHAAHIAATIKAITVTRREEFRSGSAGGTRSLVYWDWSVDVPELQNADGSPLNAEAISDSKRTHWDFSSETHEQDFSLVAV